MPKLQEILFFEKSEFSQGNHVLDSPASNTDGFLS
jgi:hypothetical protein